ncbi:PAAR-like domain-containing protein [Thioalbus denitrificans]|uniref:HNH/endonuclease VII toxin of polymorphic toxin system n=1 Tax=Thioalbus denitrificans TaxID=547122 RepID=A0A369CBP1_9GAMM|nr:PAAR-like domain-containing protein [Thioalbus denitrificans]RCX31123.1 HNH/endonuclease VII toxin of polymorphic toxin system [Thioalbus denitrificans]
MANQVYANGMEIACKAASGKSIAAFPDVCMTPPENPTTPPGVPVPYPNTGMASDTTDGSRSVRISRQEVMLKNKSHFKRSTGDEAGCAAKKGVVTSKNMGKVYFNAWSMDVKVEGENVVRNLDLTTHNHASLPGNSPTWPYLDEVAFTSPKSDSNPCADVAREVQEKCGKHVKKTKSGKNPGSVKRSQSIDAMCGDPGCAQARKCVLSPETPNNCCQGSDGKTMTPHHVIPAHCFMPPGERSSGGSARYAGCDGYSVADAPCICVEGAGKEKDHGKIHDLVDDLEDSNLDGGQAGSWDYDDAATAGVMAVGEITHCDEDCLRAQVDAYHQQEGGSPNVANDTRLRADSSGNRNLGPNVPTVPSTTVAPGISI